MDKDLEVFIKEFISTRMERIVFEAEKLPAYQKEEDILLHDLKVELAKAIGEDAAEEMITAIRGTSIPIYEHCYLVGLKDGIRFSGMIDRLKNA